MNDREDSDASASPRPLPVRKLGRFELRELIGRSQRTMAWLACDPRVGQELVIVMPREQPLDPDAAANWEHRARKAARLDHPNLAHPVEIGLQERWPFVAYDADGAQTLGSRIGSDGLPARDAADMTAQVARGLAFAHEAGMVHGDVQPYLVRVADNGVVRLMGLEIALGAAGDLSPGPDPAAPADALTEAERRRVQRAAARRDVLTLGFVLHLALSGQAALDEPDTGLVVRRLPPTGREIVRLPWATARLVPETLRAIVNRATDRQERQRYRSARTLIGALEGWLQVDAESGGGPLALLLDRLHSVGVLPGSPGAAARAARLALMERERTNELAFVVLEDVALAFEMLRAVNTATVRGAQVAGSGPVLTVRRAIAMLGLDGVRHAALALREWPGPLDERGALDLQRLIERVKRTGRMAQSLRPAGYDSEVVYLVALLQNLGWLVVQYHFPDEARQIRRLMEPSRPVDPAEPVEPGMSEELAAFAVLGVDIEAVGAAVARHWGLDDAVIHMIRRLPIATAVRSVDTDDDMLRAVASCANETLEAASLPKGQAADAVARVAQRYARALKLTLKDLQTALQSGPVPKADTAPPPDLPTLDSIA
jgi:eukaryotic-like serine/threonine-protein kinase